MNHKLLPRLIGIAGIILLAAALRLWQIESTPPGFHLDESYQGLEAWRILTEPGYHPFYLRGNFGPLPANTYLNVVTFWLVTQLGGEAGPVAMRLTASIIGLLTILALFALASELRRLSLFRSRFGNHQDTAIQNVNSLSIAFPFFAAIVLAIMRWHIHYSRMGIESIYVPLIWTVAVWLLLRAWRTGRWVSLAASGVVVGIGMYTYRGAWIIPFILGFSILHLLVMARKFDWSAGRLPEIRLGLRISQSVLWASIVILVVSPLAWFYFNNPDLFFTRLEQVNIVGNTGSPADSTIWTNLRRMMGMFGPFGSPGDLDPRRNLPGAAVLSWPLAIFFYIGLGITLWRIRHPAYGLLILSLVGLLFPGVISEYAPHFHRVLGASAPVAVICAVGIDFGWRWSISSVESLNWRRVQMAAVQLATVGLLVIGGVLEGTNYFARWANMSSLYHAFDVGLWEMGQAIAAQSAEAPIYITPRSMEHPTLAFAWETQNPKTRDETCAPTSFDGRHAFPYTANALNQPEFYAVVEHEDFRTPMLLPGVLPDYIVYQEFLDFNGEIYGRIYQRPEMSQGARPPQHPTNVALGDGIRLVGYDVQPAEVHSGEILYLQLHWQVDEKPTNDWTVFTHVRTQSAESPQWIAGYDSRPGNGSLSTQCWLAGRRILDEYQIRLPDDIPADAYQLQIGLYQPNGDHLPVNGNGVHLGTVEILDQDS